MHWTEGIYGKHICTFVDVTPFGVRCGPPFPAKAHRDIFFCSFGRDQHNMHRSPRLIAYMFLLCVCVCVLALLHLFLFFCTGVVQHMCVGWFGLGVCGTATCCTH